jgi:hypothetical protein
MKKNVRKLKLNVESLRILDGANVSGAATGDPTCALSCAPTCGVNPGTTTNQLAGAFSARVCCV